MAAGAYDNDDFEDFMEKVNSVDAAIKGLKDGSVSVEDIDRDHSDLLELAGNKQLQKEQESEKQFKKQQDKVPLRSREQAIERIKLAEKTGKKDLIAMAEEQLHDTERKIAKQKKDVEWKKDRKEVLREELVKSKHKQERWVLWKAAHPKYATKYETNYDAWDKWEPKHDIEDNEDNLMPDANRPELKAMEDDIDKRARSRRARIKEANDLKDEGNRAFKEERYVNATALYGAALQTTPWLTAAFTNRALAHIKLGNFKLAINDCKEAVAVADYNGDPPDAEICLKAMKRQAEGYEGLLKFAKAIKTLKKALELSPEHKDLAAALLATEERFELVKKEEELRERVAQEREAGESGKLVSVDDAVQAIRAGSADLKQNLTVLMSQLGPNPESRVLFHEAKGVTAVLAVLGSSECDADALAVLLSACLNPFNIEELLAIKGGIGQLMATVAPEQPANVRSVGLQLLALIADDKDGARKALAKESGIVGLVERLLDENNKMLRVHALVVARNLSAETVFRRDGRSAALLAALAKCCKPKRKDREIEEAAGAMSLLLNEEALRKAVTDGMVSDAVRVAKHGYQDSATLNVLGFLLNAAVDEGPRAVIAGAAPSELFMPLLGRPESTVSCRAMGLAARVAQSGSVAQQLVDAGIVPLVVHATSSEFGEAMQSASIRVLAVLVTKVPGAIEALKTAKFFQTGASLLTLENQAFAGNLSMIISKVAQDEANLDLLGDFVEPLVTIMHKTSGATQKNAAIACAKLARNPTYLQQIRDLHGIEIMFHYVRP